MMFVPSLTQWVTSQVAIGHDGFVNLFLFRKGKTMIAIDSGYRLIDTAASYLNEAAVGRGIKQARVPRTTAIGIVLPATAGADLCFHSIFNHHGGERVRANLNTSVHRLNKATG